MFENLSVLLKFIQSSFFIDTSDAILDIKNNKKKWKFLAQNPKAKSNQIKNTAKIVVQKR